MSTIETESQGAAQPPVIDLDAEEVAGGAETDPPTRPATEQRPEPQPRKHGFALAGIAILAAVIAGSLFYRFYGDSLWPVSETVSFSDRVAALEAKDHTISNQLAGMASTIDGMKSEVAVARDTVDGRLAAIDDAMKSLREEIGKSGSDATLGFRVAALEEAVAALKNTPAPPPPTSDAIPLARALSALHTKFADGVPYADEFAVVSRRVPDAPGLSELGKYAATGIANAQKLASDLEAIAAKITTEPKINEADSSVWGSIVAMLGSVVKVRTIGDADWKAVSTAAAAEARRGDLKTAINRLAEQPGDPGPGLNAWRQSALARLEAEAALETVSATALRIIAAAHPT